MGAPFQTVDAGGRGRGALLDSFGQTFYVSSVTGSSSYSGKASNKPKATIAQALALCTASYGDTIIVGPGHAEALTAEITVSVAGVSIIGKGNGRLRPALTATFGAAGDTLAIDADNVRIENIRFVSSGATQNAQIDVTAADYQIVNCVIEQGASNLMGVTLASGAHRGLFDGCTWLATANGPDCAIDIESSASDYVTVRNCMFNGAGFGFDLGVIRASVDAALGWLISDCQFISCDTVAIDFNSSSAAACDGVVQRCTFHATAALTSVEDIIDPGAYHFFECYAHDGTNTTTAAARVPIGTVS